MKKPDDTYYEVVSITAVTRENVKYLLNILKFLCQYILFLKKFPEQTLEHWNLIPAGPGAWQALW